LVTERLRPPLRSCKPDTVTHEQALAAIRATLDAAAGPVSIAAVDDHGEVVACLAMDGAARDTLENARRKAYTAARSDATSTRALAEKVRGSPTELASFDPAFSFFHGGVAAFSAGRRGASGSNPGRRTSVREAWCSTSKPSSRASLSTTQGAASPP